MVLIGSYWALQCCRLGFNWFLLDSTRLACSFYNLEEWFELVLIGFNWFQQFWRVALTIWRSGLNWFLLVVKVRRVVLPGFFWFYNLGEASDF